MKNRKLTRLTVTVLAASMLFSSCASKNPQISVPDGTGHAATSQAEAAVDGNLYKTGLPIVKNKETFTIAWARGTYSNKPAAEKEACITGEKDTNIHINWMEVDGTGWTEKVNIMLASQDLPDAFLGDLGTPFYQDMSFSKNLEAFQDISGLIQKYSPSLVKAMDQYPILKTYLTQRDGTIRCLPVDQAQKKDETTSTIYWINQAWLNKVGKKMPTNINELEDVLVAFRDKDPNGNGKRDEIPLTFCNQDWAGRFSSLLGPFGVLDPDNHVLVENGKVVFQPIQKGMYDALQYYHKLYAEGLIDKEGFSQTVAQSVAKMNQNIHGIIACYDPSNKIGPNSTFVPLGPIMGPDGTTVFEGSTEPKINRCLFITKACKDPAALVRYYEYVNSDFKRKLTWNYGPENFLWKLNSNQTWNQLENNLKKGEVWDRVRYTVGFGPASFAFFPPDECGQIEDRFVEDRLKAVKELTPYYPKEPYHALPDEPADASEKNMLKTEIDAYVSNFIATSLVQGVDEAKWNKHLETCKTLNVNRYVELMQKSYDAFNASEKAVS